MSGFSGITGLLGGGGGGQAPESSKAQSGTVGGQINYVGSSNGGGRQYGVAESLQILRQLAQSSSAQGSPANGGNGFYNNSPVEVGIFRGNTSQSAEIGKTLLIAGVLVLGYFIYKRFS